MKYSVSPRNSFLFSKPKRIYLGKPQYLVVIRVLFGQREANVELFHGFSSVTWYKNEILFFSLTGHFHTEKLKFDMYTLLLYYAIYVHVNFN